MPVPADLTACDHPRCALHGPEKEVFFPQGHVPGREASLDFTHATDLGVTVRGAPLVHLLFQLVLSFSGWTWVEVAFGETFEALVHGLQEAFWSLGAVTEVARSDNLSAATHELREGKGISLNARFQAVLEHYGLKSTRIQPSESHENDVAGATRQLPRPGEPKKKAGTPARKRKESRPVTWSGKPDSNRRPSAWEADALPTELFPRNRRRSSAVIGRLSQGARGCRR